MPRPVGNGAGWGGPAKGAGSPAKPFGSDSPTRQTIPGGKGDPAKMMDRAGKRARREAIADEMFEHLVFLAKNATSEQVQKGAAEAVMNRVEGMPTARQEHSGPDGAPLITGLHVSFVEPDGGSEES